MSNGTDDLMQALSDLGAKDVKFVRQSSGTWCCDVVLQPQSDDAAVKVFSAGRPTPYRALLAVWRLVADSVSAATC